MHNDVGTCTVISPKMHAPVIVFCDNFQITWSYLKSFQCDQSIKLILFPTDSVEAVKQVFS